jgi:hypothetical protein
MADGEGCQAVRLLGNETPNVEHRTPDFEVTGETMRTISRHVAFLLAVALGSVVCTAGAAHPLIQQVRRPCCT